MQSISLSQDPGLDGPDYLALIIEWNDDDAADTLVTSEVAPAPAHRPGAARTIAAVVGALGALLLAAWGIRRLRAA